MLEATRPPPQAVELHVWVLDDQAQVQSLGASVFAAVSGQVPGAVFTFGAVVDKVVVVATEMSANAIGRGLMPTIVRLYRCELDLILDVADHDTQMLPEFADSQPAGAAGLGLRLAQRYALTVGWYITDSTRHIWARFPLHDDRRVTPGAERPPTKAGSADSSR